MSLIHRCYDVCEPLLAGIDTQRASRKDQSSNRRLKSGRARNRAWPPFIKRIVQLVDYEIADIEHAPGSIDFNTISGAEKLPDDAQTNQSQRMPRVCDDLFRLSVTIDRGLGHDRCQQRNSVTREPSLVNDLRHLANRIDFEVLAYELVERRLWTTQIIGKGG